MCHVVFIGGTTNISDMTIFPAKLKEKRKEESNIRIRHTLLRVVVPVCMTVVTDGTYEPHLQ